ncbi:leucine zipper protein 1 [Pristis pectinata]|uniref:leucine zipper protein 1 n=1 Tax=Pristis pectinata TaxID=685728 RepID=UPI00223E0B9D|nr:leucine zipper protein 1 [Pristis pectinata]
MTDMMSLKETSTRQLRLKLTSLGRRVDELEEATRSLHRMEDEIMDLQDKVIQAEGSNSSLLSEVDVLRKRVLAIEGKDEEVRKAEDMCRNLKEKLEAEVKLSKDLKEEIEKLQDRMAELEKLEEAFNRSKSDCTQLGLSLNEEKNLTRKLTSELELLRGRVKELESSENRLDKSEKSIIEELEKLKSLTVILAEERKAMNETLQENEQVIQDLTMKLEMNNRINTVDQSKNSSNLRTNVNEKTYGYTGDRGDLRIEENMSTGLSSKGSLGKGGLDSLTITHNVELRNKESQGGQEDNKIKDLTQEIERLKKRLTFLEMVEEDLKKTEAKHNELQEKFLNEQSLAKLLGSQIEEMKQQMSREKALGNGETTQQEVRTRSRQDKPKYRGLAAEPQVPKDKSQELSSQPRSQREKMRNRDLLLEDDNVGRSYRRPLSPSTGRRFQRASSNPRVTAAVEKKSEEKVSVPSYEQKDQDLLPEKVKKMREPPSVLSRYPPAANESNVKRPWGAHSKQSVNGPKGKPDRDNGDLEQSAHSDRQRKAPNCAEVSENEKPAAQDEGNDPVEEPVSTTTTPALLNGTVTSYRNHSASPSSYTETKNSFVVEFEVPLATDNEPTPAKPAEKPPADPEAVTGATPVTTRPRRSKYLHSSRSQDLGLEYTAVKCCPEEDPPRYKWVEAATAEDVTVNQKAGPELKRVCSPREGLRSKAIIKPAIIAIDKKEVMTARVETSTGDHQLSPKTVPNKVTSSITILPSELSSQRTSSVAVPKEKHTSTSNITIGSSEPSVQRSNISIPYEISIRRSDITMKPSESDSSEEDETESVSGVSVSSSVTIKSSEVADDESSAASYRSRRSRLANHAETKSLSVDAPERTTWRNSRADALTDAAKHENDLGLDYSRLTPRRTNSGGSGISSEGYTRRLSNYSNSSDTVESRRSPTSDPSRSYVSVTETVTRRKQNASVASKVADWNNSCSLSGQESSDLLSALNASVMSKRKEMAKQILSDIVTERVPRTEAVGKRQSVKLELRRNPESNPTQQTGAKTEDRTPVGILSQIRMTSRR